MTILADPHPHQFKDPHEPNVYVGDVNKSRNHEIETFVRMLGVVDEYESWTEDLHRRDVTIRTLKKVQKVSFALELFGFTKI